jgi:uncharacterized protein with FMN-binding domain
LILRFIYERNANKMKIFKIVLFSIGGLIALMVVLSLFLTIGMGEIKKLAINDVDLKKISDGVYKGSYYKSRWTYDVEVMVKDHKIVDVTNTNRQMAVQKDFNAKVATAIMKNQSPRIDIVSGATVSTRAYQKAVENALESAPQNPPK